jgi:hypothetical protein
MDEVPTRMAEIKVPLCFNPMLSLAARKVREAWGSTYIQRPIPFTYCTHSSMTSSENSLNVPFNVFYITSGGVNSYT